MEISHAEWKVQYYKTLIWSWWLYLQEEALKILKQRAEYLYLPYQNLKTIRIRLMYLCSEEEVQQTFLPRLLSM